MEILQYLLFITILIVTGVAIILLLKLIVRIGLLPLIQLMGDASNILEKVFTLINRYFVGFVNLLFLSVVMDRCPDMLERIKRAMLCQECRALFQKYGAEKYYSNIPDHQIELDKLAANIDLVYTRVLPLMLVGGIIFDIYAKRKNVALRKKLNAANITGSWAKKDSYEFIVTAFDRFYSAGFYSLPILDVYNKYGQSFLTLFPSWWVYNPVFQALHRIVYGDLQTVTFGIFLSTSFFFLYYGISRNRDYFTFFVRYHAMQSSLIGVLLTFYNTIFKFILYLQPEHGLYKSCFWEADTLIIAYLIMTPMVVTAIMGIETRMPGFDEAILYHIAVRPPKKSAKNVNEV